MKIFSPPDAGKSGTIVRWEIIGMFGHEGPKPVIRCDDGAECFAMSANDFGVIPTGRKRRNL